MSSFPLRVVEVATIVTVASAARADLSLTFALKVKHDVLQPGQSQEIELWASFSPRYKEPAPPPFGPGLKGYGLWGVDVDVNNVTGANTGVFLNQQVHGYTTPATVSPEGDLKLFSFRNGIPETPTFDLANPILLAAVDWVPNAGPKRTIKLETGIGSWPGYWQPVLILHPFDSGNWKSVFAQVVNHDQVSWTVLPVPSSLALVAAAGLFAVRRRR